MKIYQAGPLFTEAERAWHRAFGERLKEAGFEAVWPGDLISPGDGLSARQIMETDRDALLSCHAVVALLDGPQVDDGTAWEIGYAFAKGIPVVGLRTDFRLCSDSEGSMVNAMIEGSVLDICTSIDEALAVLGTLRRGMGLD